MKYIKLFEQFNKESVNESFYRLPSDIIDNELYLASKNLNNLYNNIKAGNDLDTGVIDSIIKKLNTIKKSAKKFNNTDEIKGTVYEGETNSEEYVNEGVDITVSLRYARGAAELFDDMFRGYGKKESTDSFRFKNSDSAIDFVKILVNRMQVPMSEIEMPDKIKNEL